MLIINRITLCQCLFIILSLQSVCCIVVKWFEKRRKDITFAPRGPNAYIMKPAHWMQVNIINQNQYSVLVHRIYHKLFDNETMHYQDEYLNVRLPPYATSKFFQFSYLPLHLPKYTPRPGTRLFDEWTIHFLYRSVNYTVADEFLCNLAPEDTKAPASYVINMNANELRIKKHYTGECKTELIKA